MGHIIKAILDKFNTPLTYNPYQEGVIDYWRSKAIYPVFAGRTISRYKINYKLTLHIYRIDNTEFNKARMLEEDNINDLGQAFNDDFLRWMRETRRHFYIDNLHGIGSVIVINNNGDIDEEINCSNTTKEFNKRGFIKCGCRVRLIMLDARIADDDENLIQENYDMIDKDVRKAIERNENLRKYHETWTIILLKELIKVQKAWKKQMLIGVNRVYKGKWIEIHTECQGSEVIFRWNYKNDAETARFHLHGFRREGAFAIDDADSSQGALVIDSWGSDWKTEHLEEKKTYYYTFKVSYLHKKNSVESNQELVRFEITTPPEKYEDLIEQRMNAWVENIQSLSSSGPEIPVQDPKKEKMKRAFEELSTFIEFDESITQWEKDLIKQIESKGYSAKERRDKIERLKLAVEALRIDRL